MASMILSLSCLSVKAETWRFKATAFAYRTYEYKTNTWNDWTLWKRCDIDIISAISMERKTIWICSPKIQRYEMMGNPEESTDSDGDTHIIFEAYDSSHNNCRIKFLEKKNEGVELYVEYDNMKWCYEIINYDNIDYNVY